LGIRKSDSSDYTNYWTLHFDGSKSQEGAGSRCILRDSKRKLTILACRLEFEGTNNIDEYEALLQGLKKVVDLKVKNIKLFGDSKFILRQVNNTIHCNLGHLKNYQNKVWHLKSLLDSFDISSIANVASKLLPSKDFIRDKLYVQLLFKPLVPNNVTNWRVLMMMNNCHNFYIVKTLSKIK